MACAEKPDENIGWKKGWCVLASFFLCLVTFIMDLISVQDIESILDFWGVNGCAVAIVRRVNNEWRHTKLCVGRRNSSGDLVDENTRFFIASNSKLFCALAVGLALREAGFKDGFKTRIKDAVPEYELHDVGAGRNVTFEHALSHTTGLPRHDNYTSNEVTTLEQQLEIIKAMRPSLKLGQANQYHNPHYDLMALIVERLTQKPYEEYLVENILRPLGLTSTAVSPKAAVESTNHAAGFWQYGETPKADGESIELPCGLRDSAACKGAGSMSSTATDMSRWLQCLLTKGKDIETDDSIVPADLLDACAAKPIRFHEYARDAPELGPAYYGLGLSSQTFLDLDLREHVGSLPGWMSRLCLVPEKDFGVFIMTNGAPFGEYVHEEIKYKILQAAFGVPEVDWRQRFLEERRVAASEKQAKIDAALILDSSRSENSSKELDITGRYSSPGFHRWVIKDEHILNSAPDTVSEIPGLPYLWGQVQPLLWHVGGAKYKIFWRFTFPAEVNRQPLIGNMLDVEIDLDESGKSVKGLGVRGIWGAGKGVPSPEGERVLDRSEMYYTREEL